MKRQQLDTVTNHLNGSSELPRHLKQDYIDLEEEENKAKKDKISNLFKEVSHRHKIFIFLSNYETLANRQNEPCEQLRIYEGPLVRTNYLKFEPNRFAKTTDITGKVNVNNLLQSYNKKAIFVPNDDFEREKMIIQSRQKKEGIYLEKGTFRTSRNSNNCLSTRKSIVNKNKSIESLPGSPAYRPITSVGYREPIKGKESSNAKFSLGFNSIEEESPVVLPKLASKKKYMFNGELFNFHVARKKDQSDRVEMYNSDKDLSNYYLHRTKTRASNKDSSYKRYETDISKVLTQDSSQNVSTFRGVNRMSKIKPSSISLKGSLKALI